MTEQEFNQWAKLQMTNAGHWRVDEIHNTPEDTLVFCAMRSDPSTGIFVHLEKGQLTTGLFSDAIPHIGESTFKIKNTIKTTDPFKHAVERLGLSFLLAFTHGIRPYQAS